MKKGLKVGLGLTALGLVGGAQEGIAANSTETNKNVREILGEKKDSKINDSTTYVTTAADFGKPTEKKIENTTTDSLDITQTVSLLNDSINALVQSYGKDGINEKINKIKEEHPDFESLSEAKQKEIVMEVFLDKPNSITATIGEIIIFIWLVRLAMLFANLTSGSRRR